MSKKKRGVGRPRVKEDEENKVVCFRLPLSDYQHIEGLAQLEEREVSNMLRLLIKEALKARDR